MMELYDIVQLANGKEYTIAKMLPYNDEIYYFLVEVDTEENLLDEQLIVKLNANRDGFEKIEDKNKAEEIKTLFVDMIMND